MAPRFSTSRGSGRYRWVPRARGALFQERERSGDLQELDVWDFLWRTGVNEGCPEMYSSPPAQKISRRWIRSAGLSPETNGGGCAFRSRPRLGVRDFAPLQKRGPNRHATSSAFRLRSPVFQSLRVCAGALF